MSRGITGLAGAALIALPLVGSQATLAQRSNSAGSSASSTHATGPAGATGAGAHPSRDTTANGSNAAVGNSSPTAASQGWPHAGDRKRDPASRAPGEKNSSRSTR
jgi:hypothetical protein